MSAQDDDQNLLDQYLEKQTSRLTVTDNYIWTIIAVAWLVVVSPSICLAMSATSSSKCASINYPSAAANLVDNFVSVCEARESGQSDQQKHSAFDADVFERQALLAPHSVSNNSRKEKTRNTIRFRDCKIDHAKRGLIQQHTGPGELSFDNIMQLRFSRTMRNLLVPLAFVSSMILLCVYYSGVFGMESFSVLSDLVNNGAVATASKISSATVFRNSTSPTQIGSFARLTIEHCPEPVLWAPILVALSINVLAHAGLWYQCRNVSLRSKRLIFARASRIVFDLSKPSSIA